MKFSSTALLLLGAATHVSGERKASRNKMTVRGLRDGNGRQLSGKKGGKRGDCNEDATVISSCNTVITQSGRYVLEKNLKCEQSDVFGIALEADDIRLDCQGNQIRGLGFSESWFGIGISGANHVSVANCKVQNFFVGLLVDPTVGTWNDVIVEDSSFNKNTFGMVFDGEEVTDSNSYIVLHTEAKKNEVDGLIGFRADGTIVSSTFSDNGVRDDSDGVGLYFRFGSNTLIIGVKANNNIAGGLLTLGDELGLSTETTAVNSEFCGNPAGNIEFFFSADIFMAGSLIAQGNTCDTSEPMMVGGRDVCECPCKGKAAASSGVGSSAATGFLEKVTIVPAVHPIMKFSASALLLLLGSVSFVSGERKASRNKVNVRDLTEDDHGRQLSGKKGGGTGKGGKKGDCTDGYTVISACDTIIDQPGRYVLEKNLKCEDSDFLGIGIAADDVRLDCQGNQIIGGIDGDIGIGITLSNHVSIANCHVRNFNSGLFVSTFFAGPWDDVVIEDSSFNKNFIGMTFFGDGNSDSNRYTIVGSKALENDLDGLQAFDSYGTIVSSTFSKNFGSDEIGVAGVGVYFVFGSATLIDVKANNNGGGGILSFSAEVASISSEFCGNDEASSTDLLLYGDILVDGGSLVAQGNTCETSIPMMVGGRDVCECLCKGKDKSKGVSGTGGASADVSSVLSSGSSRPQAIPADETIVLLSKGLK
ncbi:hypothetical protein IV203_021710 [Nitzschia inconspicua]|uniref:Right handed beta helix domain-containing protein n=1 Tax=Nitzschia inconspicua TaxID=303405 RepID=A0A9K3KHH8_9STRA|nr:hypothetical protein IV203_021710 [Nitzschia inconspicua]